MRSRSEIANGDFKAALELSLKRAGLLCEPAGAPRFRARATLLGIAPPGSGFDTTVKLQVRYEVTDLRSGERVLDEVIASQYTAAVSDALMPEERLQIATEGAARESIASFIAKARAIR